MNRLPLLRILSFLAVLGLLAPAPRPAVAAEPESPVAAALRLERRLLPVDLADYREARGREREARERLREAANRLDQLLAGEELSLGSLESLREQAATSAAAVEVAEKRADRLLTRIEERLRRLSFLDGETRAQTPVRDPLAGRWRFELRPQGRTGNLVLVREGSLITGTIEVPGSGVVGIRGTFTNNGLRFDRLNPRGEVDATFLGTLVIGAQTLSGEWQSSRLGAGEPESGTWSAVRLPDTPAPSN